MQIPHPNNPAVMLDVVIVDFETFYSVDFTLSGGLSVSEYVRDDRFHAHGAAVLTAESAATAAWVTRSGLRKKFASIDWSKTALLAHNCQFDGFILAELYGVRPAFYLDTLAMARGTVGHHVKHGLDPLGKLLGVGGKEGGGAALVQTKGLIKLTAKQNKDLGEYAKVDAIRCLQIFQKLYEHVPDKELRLIDWTMRQFCEPILEIDLALVQEELESEVGAKISALFRAGCSVGDLASADKFQGLLLAAGLPASEVPYKLSLTTGKKIPAFAKSDDGFKELLCHSDPKIAALAEARMRIKSTIGETRAERFLEAGRDGMKLPVGLNYAKAHTYRWTGGNKMNLQNLVRGGRLRRAIRAPNGYSVVVADSGQIEARVTAWLANHTELLAGFAAMTPTDTSDVYTRFASKFVGFVVIKGSKLQEHKDARQIGKICILGLGYGMGHKKLDETLRKAGFKLGLAKCQTIVDLYRSDNWKIKQLWKDCDGLLASMVAGGSGTFKGLAYGKDWIRLPSGLFLRYPGLKCVHAEQHDGRISSDYSYRTISGWAKIYGGSLTENLAQALARCIISDQMLATEDEGIRVATMTHDEIVGLAKTEHADAALELMIKIMATAPVWCSDLALAAEGGHALNYSK